MVNSPGPSQEIEAGGASKVKRIARLEEWFRKQTTQNLLDERAELLLKLEDVNRRLVKLVK